MLVFAQLRDVLAAEDSAVVAKENQDGGIVFPERAEPDLLAESVGETMAAAAAEGFRHDGPMIVGGGLKCQGRVVLQSVSFFEDRHQTARNAASQSQAKGR